MTLQNDAGSNQISVLNVQNGHLSLKGDYAPGGAGPVSLTYQDGLLYVLNAAKWEPDIGERGRLPYWMMGGDWDLSPRSPQLASIPLVWPSTRLAHRSSSSTMVAALPAHMEPGQ